MANTFAPFGFRSFGSLEGNTPTYGLTKRNINGSDTAAYFTGDAIQLSTVSSFLGFIGLPSTGTAQPILGIFAGCEFFSNAAGKMVWSPFFPGTGASSAVPIVAYSVEGEDNVFLVQTTTAAVVGASNIGQNFTMTSTGTLGTQSSGNQTTGISNVALVSGSAGTGSSLAFRLVDLSCNVFPPGTNGTDSTTAGSVVIVSFNNTLRRSLTGVG